MTPSQIALMGLVEGNHWWYRGLRDALQRTLRSPRFRLPPQARILDAGCGTGANLALLQRLAQPAYLGGFDLSPLAVQLCREKVQGADVYVSDLRDPVVHASGLDLVLSCDALSIAGIAASLRGLSRLVACLRSGGLLILNLPAFEWLRSSHDAAMDTSDRVTVTQVRSLFTRLGLSAELVTYRVFLLFPSIVLRRIPSMVRRPSPRSDLKPTRAWISALFSPLLQAENAAIVRGMRFPWGSSVYAVARRP